jgi:hypothetical protein
MRYFPLNRYKLRFRTNGNIQGIRFLCSYPLPHAQFKKLLKTGLRATPGRPKGLGRTRSDVTQHVKTVFERFVNCARVKPGEITLSWVRLASCGKRKPYLGFAATISHCHFFACRNSTCPRDILVNGTLISVN